MITVICFFRPVFHQKIYSREIIFAQLDQIEWKWVYKSHVVAINWGDCTACAGEKEIACCVRGHVYKDIWAAAIQEVLGSQPKFLF